MTNKKIYRAGLIPYYIEHETDTIQMLFQRPSSAQRGSYYFQCLKGKAEGDETPLETAIREAQEEGGLFVPNINGQPHELGVFLGRTTMFVAEITDPSMFGEHDSEVESTRWMSPDEFESEGRDLHKPIIKAAARWITKSHSLDK